MINQSDGNSLEEIGLPQSVFAHFEKAKDFLEETTQQTKESLSATAGKVVNTIYKATDRAVDTASSTAKDSLEQTLRKADQLSSATSNTVQTAISDSVSEWLQVHPVVFRLVQLLLWATNHPIVSLLTLLFTVAFAWSLIRALGRLIEMAGWSLLKAPFKLSQVLIGVSAKSMVKGIEGEKNHLRLAEISIKLEAIQKEQNELLTEAAALLASSDSLRLDNEKQLPAR